jgi:cysteine desulfurase
LAALRSKLEVGVVEAGGVIIAAGSPRIPTIGTVALRGVSNAALMVQMDLAGISVSAGSACSSGKMQASEVMAAMHVPPDLAASFLRVSFGPSTSEAEVDRFLGEWRKLAERATARAA